MFALIMAAVRRHGGQLWLLLRRSRNRDLFVGAFAGIATALIGMAGPPVLIYLLLAGTAAQTVRATLLAFFALSYGATLTAPAATIGIPRPTWIAAGTLVPFALLGGVAGRPIGDRLGTEGFALLAIGLLTAAGLYTIAGPSIGLVTHQP